MELFIKIIFWVKRFLEEPSGKPSIKRLWGSAVITVFLINYTKVTIETNTLNDIPQMWAFLITGMILGLGALKVWKDKRDEN